MANAEWGGAALIGALIQTTGGIQVAADDIDLQVEGLGRSLRIPLREIREGVVLWARLRTVPHDAHRERKSAL